MPGPRRDPPTQTACDVPRSKRGRPWSRLIGTSAGRVATNADPPAPVSSPRASVPAAPHAPWSRWRRGGCRAQSVQLTRLAYEVWTKNRVYNLDGTMCCFEVIDLRPARARSTTLHRRASGRWAAPNRRGQRALFPLPVPGSDAVFQKTDDDRGIRLAVTSAVTRVILHVHRVDVRARARSGLGPNHS